MAARVERDRLGCGSSPYGPFDARPAIAAKAETGLFFDVRQCDQIRPLSAASRAAAERTQAARTDTHDMAHSADGERGLVLFDKLKPHGFWLAKNTVAILLCLAGGWPASAECTHARAVFIRRITPWPIEPPLQIWRCPMGVSDRAPLQSTAPKIWEASNQSGQALGQFILAQMVGGGADIDISGSEFDFVRSIRVWDVRHYSHRESGSDDDCSENYNMRLGTYGTQGEFSWQRTTPAAAPHWVLPSRRCLPSSWRRGVGVEWEDHEGNHGYEWVAY